MLFHKSVFHEVRLQEGCMDIEQQIVSETCRCGLQLYLFLTSVTVLLKCAKWVTFSAKCSRGVSTIWAGASSVYMNLCFLSQNGDWEFSPNKLSFSPLQFVLLWEKEPVKVPFTSIPELHHLSQTSASPDPFYKVPATVLHYNELVIILFSSN